MYPDWPESDANLVPLPLCDGPKLGPFDFQGPQKMEFVQLLGEGLHAYVFKVKILGQLYALKLFRFEYEWEWEGFSHPWWADKIERYDNKDLVLISAFYHYSDPFNCECRAFGRLQEAGHEELAVACYGYVLLDEEHKRRAVEVMEQSGEPGLRLNGNMEDWDSIDMRSRFVSLSRSKRLAPIRCIVKKLGVENEEGLRAPLIRKFLHDIVKLQQLGIVRIDPATRQIVDDRICDFSTALTAPHFMINPELNPYLTPRQIDAIELELFVTCTNDYYEFDEMVGMWNYEFGPRKRPISVRVYPA